MRLAFASVCLLAASFSLAHGGQKTQAELEAELAQTRAALAQLAASQTATGASSPADCETVLHTLLAQLAKLSNEGKQQADSLNHQVETTSAYVTLGTHEIRQAQDVNNEATQAAVAKVAAESHNTQLTQILGFLTVMATMALKVWTESRHHTETAGRIAALAQAVERKNSEAKS